MTIHELKNSMTQEDVIAIMEQLGADSYRVSGDALRFQTICHNAPGEGDYNLAYYHDNKTFHCFSECGETFDIIDLVRRTHLGHTMSTQMILKFIFGEIDFESRIDEFNEVIKKYSRKRLKCDVINDSILQVYDFLPVTEWLSEGISEASMRKYGVLYSAIDNGLIIPHKNKEGNVIGIRIRYLDDYQAQFGKYRPLKAGKITYAHPLSYSPYGIYEAKEAIRYSKKCFVFEGEKSVLKKDSFYDLNNAVATCGSTLSRQQVNRIIECGAEEIILCYDKEYENTCDGCYHTYYDKLKGICNKHKIMCDFSFVMDFTGFLDRKDSPIDKGKDVFDKLVKSRIKVL